MASDALATIDTSEVKAEVAPVLAAADGLVIRDVGDHQRGMEMLGSVMAAERKVKAFFLPALTAAQETKRKAEEGRQAVVLLQDTVLGVVLEARKIISAKCAAFEAEERRVAALNQSAINAAALAAQDEGRRFDAAMAETEEDAEKALTVALPPPVVPTVRPEVAKVAGVSTRETWSGEITDLRAYYAWCITGDNLYMAGEPNMVALNSRARTEREQMNIPGARAVPKLSHAGR